jgi:hypothetical protein
MTKFTQTYPTDLKYTEWLLIFLGTKTVEGKSFGSFSFGRCFHPTRDTSLRCVITLE